MTSPVAIIQRLKWRELLPLAVITLAMEGGATSRSAYKKMMSIYRPKVNALAHLSELIMSYIVKGFSTIDNPIAVNKQGIPVDGYHRLAYAYLGLIQVAYTVENNDLLNYYPSDTKEGCYDIFGFDDSERVLVDKRISGIERSVMITHN